jgi:4-carboxymuconolactone decarboxylase
MTDIFQQGQLLPKEWFTGNAYLTPLAPRNGNNDFSIGSVAFDSCARTNWHVHPRGQTLLVIDGSGFYQEKDGPARPINKGDVVIIPEDIEHWHGAGASSGMTHIAITNYKDDAQVTWHKPVTDEEYSKANKQ